jgi:hypothetical protein
LQNQRRDEQVAQSPVQSDSKSKVENVLALNLVDPRFSSYNYEWGIRYKGITNRSFQSRTAHKEVLPGRIAKYRTMAIISIGRRRKAVARTARTAWLRRANKLRKGGNKREGDYIEPDDLRQGKRAKMVIYQTNMEKREDAESSKMVGKVQEAQ